MDTGAWGAIANPSDAEHRTALSVANLLQRERYRLVTSNFVLAETHALVLSRVGRNIALRMLDLVDQSSEVVRSDPEDELQARQILDRYDDKDFSYTDAVSFAMMERLRISSAFTFDRHFVQYGFRAIRLA